MNSNGFARLATAAIGAAGVVGSHTLAYRLAHAPPAGQHHPLESSSHGYWDLALLLGLAGLIVGIGVEMAFGSRRSDSPRPPFFTWLRLFVIQGLAFAALESLERAVQGPEQLSLLFQERAFWLAFPLLFLTAALGCALLILARRAGATLARRRRPVAEQPVALRLQPHSVRVMSHVLVSITRERGPPPSPVH
ncbi:MAG: hypothetical protein ACRDJL_01050 [Actinomycetota bacterium]